MVLVGAQNHKHMTITCISLVFQRVNSLRWWFTAKLQNPKKKKKFQRLVVKES